MSFPLPPMWIWAAREALRRPAEAVFGGFALWVFVTIFGTVLLLSQALADTASLVLAEAPPLVVRHVDGGGWAPMPEDAEESARSVRGVTRAMGRVWGVVQSDFGPVTVVGLPARSQEHELAFTLDEPGKAVVGSAFPADAPGTVALVGAERVQLQVVERLPAEQALVAHDLVFVHPSDARALLGLRDDQVSDVAVWVFHDAEMDAIRPDLTAAFAFGTRISTRSESSKAAVAQVERVAGSRAALLLPALVALLLLAAAGAREHRNNRRSVALLKTFGWTTADLVRLYLLRAILVALPALALGLGAAYALVFVPELVGGASWIHGWSPGGPRLILTPSGSLLILGEVGAIALIPWLVAQLLPIIKSTSTDPEQWLLGEEG